MDDIPRIMIGIIHFLVALCGFLLLISISFIVISTRELRSVSSYRLLLQLNLAILVQVLVHMFTSIKTIFKLVFNTREEQLLGAIMNFSWMATMTLNFLLAIERLCIIVFSKSDRRRPITSIAVTVIAWLPASVVFAIDMSSYTGYVFSILDSNWVYLEGQWTGLAMRLEQAVTFSTLIGAFASYLVIFAHIAMYRTNSQSKVEFRILFISAISFLYIFGEECFYQFGSSLIPGRSVAMIVNGLFTAYPLFCQIIHLVFNSKLRTLIMLKSTCTTNITSVSFRS
uniref:Serpentine receptor class gamma n=1 Tax=Steinernema glaseri TaxID=37863 RepID=A0A1I7ZYJ7_9BILA